MYFIVRNNIIYSFAARINPAYRYMITVSVLIFCVFLWLYGIYYPLDKVINRYHKELVKLSSQALQIGMVDKACGELSDEMVKIESNLKLDAQNSTCQEVEQSHLFFILNQAKKVGLQLNACNTHEGAHHDWYTNHEISCDCTGTLPQITTFLNDLKTAQKMIQCDQLHIQHVQDPLFTMNCTLRFSTLKS